MKERLLTLVLDLTPAVIAGALTGAALAAYLPPLQTAAAVTSIILAAKL